MSDIYRDTFLALVRSGKTPLEALQAFKQADWNAAVMKELESGRVVRNPKTFKFETRFGEPALLELQIRASQQEMNDKDLEQAIELWLAGWTSEKPLKSQEHVFQWFWRRPPRRPGISGRRYNSTNQAYMAMKRQQKL